MGNGRRLSDGGEGNNVFRPSHPKVIEIVLEYMYVVS